MSKLLLVLSMALLLAGCATISRSFVSRKLDAKPTDCAVEILSVPPQRAFEEVAALKLEGDFNTLSPYVEKIKREVCELGGDAAIVSPIRTGPLLNSEGSVTVIRWR